MKNKTILTISILFTTAVAGLAQPIGPSYPAPGGNTFSSNGQQAISATGREGYYSGFDPAQFSQLYWTFSSIANPYANSQGITGTMNFSGYNPGTGLATWVSSANLTWNVAFGGNAGSVESIGTKLVLQFVPYGSVVGQLGSGWLTPTTATAANILLSGTQSVLDVAAIGGSDSFQVWYQYQTLSGTPLQTFYNSFNNIGDSVNTSSSGAFYSVAPVPEPSTMAMSVIGGLGGLLMFRRRK